MRSAPVFTKRNVAWAQAMERQSKSGLSWIIGRAYGFRIFRPFCIWFACKLEGGHFFSRTLRKSFEKYHRVRIGKYSYGSCFKLGVLPCGTQVGAYCSFADRLKVFRRNHPVDVLSQHPFFYNKLLGLVQEDTINSNEENPLIIGNDVWVGDGVTILPSCKSIGDGAILGAGSVITRNVEPFTIVAGNPAKLIKRRFSEDVETLIRQSKWWELPLAELLSADTLLIDKADKEHLIAFVNAIKSTGIAND